MVIFNSYVKLPEGTWIENENTCNHEDALGEFQGVTENIASSAGIYLTAMVYNQQYGGIREYVFFFNYTYDYTILYVWINEQIIEEFTCEYTYGYTYEYTYEYIYIYTFEYTYECVYIYTYT